MESFLDSKKNNECFGCEACVQICPKNAIKMNVDNEGFRYPTIDKKECIHCNICRKICPYSNMPQKYKEKQYAWGGYHKDWKIRDASTSGGAFSAIVDVFCDNNYVIFGATAKGLKVSHTYVDDKDKIEILENQSTHKVI